VAVFATARKLATLSYRMLRWGQNYVDEGAEVYEKRYREARLHCLTSIARELGYQLAPLAAKA
jgi:transposase